MVFDCGWKVLNLVLSGGKRAPSLMLLLEGVFVEGTEAVERLFTEKSLGSLSTVVSVLRFSQSKF